MKGAALRSTELTGRHQGAHAKAVVRQRRSLLGVGSTPPTERRGRRWVDFACRVLLFAFRHRALSSHWQLSFSWCGSTESGIFFTWRGASTRCASERARPTTEARKTAPCPRRVESQSTVRWSGETALREIPAIAMQRQTRRRPAPRAGPSPPRTTPPRATGGSSRSSRGRSGGGGGGRGRRRRGRRTVCCCVRL